MTLVVNIMSGKILQQSSPKRKITKSTGNDFGNFVKPLCPLW